MTGSVEEPHATASARGFLALALTLAMSLAASHPAWAQSPPPSEDTRAGRIAAEQQVKSTQLHPREPDAAEVWVRKLEEQFLTGALHWHPFFESAYAGGGFTLGAGYLTHVSDYNWVDLRGSVTFSGYTRLEGEFRAPRLFDRRGDLSIVGGWRYASQVGFFGIGTDTSVDDRANYSFTQPYVSAVLDVRPTRRYWRMLGGVEYSQWAQGAGKGSYPSVDEVYTPETLPGLDATVNYLRVSGTLGFDWRTSEGYTRRGGFYGITGEIYDDVDDVYSFQQVNYEVIQHVPLFRDAWVLSLRGRVQTTYPGDDKDIPFFMLPALGGGSSLRGFTSWRFRDYNSILVQAEWRVLVNNFFDTAIFYDAGKVTSNKSDLDFNGLKSDVGIGLRLHGPAATPLRIELAKSNEGWVIVWAAHASF